MHIRVWWWKRRDWRTICRGIIVWMMNRIWFNCRI